MAAIQAVVLASSWCLTGIVRRYTIKQGILDVPNERSSHLVVTPRGGGMAIVVVFLGGVFLMTLYGTITRALGITLGGGGLVVAAIGWLDDKRGLTPQLRAFFHLVAAAWALYWLGGFPGIDLGFTCLRFNGIGTVLAVVGTVWMINLYNFMDGIDGIAGTEAIIVAVTAGVLLVVGGNLSLALLCWALASAVGGFLIWNWPPAKIFMGDVASGFLGFVLATLAIASENSGELSIIIWLVLLGVFVVDATVTLLIRVLQGERWYEAHRTHVYQLAVQAGYSHKQVTRAVLGLNLCLAVVAGIAWLWPQWLLAVGIVALLMLVTLHVQLRSRFTGMMTTKARAVQGETLGQLAASEEKNGLMGHTTGKDDSIEF